MLGLKSKRRVPEVFVSYDRTRTPYGSGEPPAAQPAPAPTPLVKPVAAQIEAMDREGLASYTEAANAAHLDQPLLRVEALKRFLADNDITVFPLTTVVPYMDEIARRESSNKCGWLWRPLRDKDQIEMLSWGGTKIGTVVSSDHYKGRTYPTHGWDIAVYDRVIPLHALRKVNIIEALFEYHDHVKVFVSDYATPRDFDPDPFLMVVIPNPFLKDGVGRFVIDVWDEPGFGIKEQLGIADVPTNP